VVAREPKVCLPISALKSQGALLPLGGANCVMNLSQARVLAQALSNAEQCDIYLYNGAIERGHDLTFIKLVEKNKSSATRALLYLVSRGGDPDAGYKIARMLQDTYTSFAVVLPGLCKSAGTLICAGAHELRLGPYGEIGPLDIQTYKTDNLTELQSGLNITEAIETLSYSAIKKHGEMFSSIMAATSGIVSFPTAASAATALINGLYGPIFGRIDPYEVGDKARAMRIALDYGRRLSLRTSNLRPTTLNMLTRTYPSHSFVIDKAEAELLFVSVKAMSGPEIEIAKLLDEASNDEVAQTKNPLIECLATYKPPSRRSGGARAKAQTQRRRGASRNGPNPSGTAGAPALPAPTKRRRKGG
jgi:hypothetical protein